MTLLPIWHRATQTFPGLAQFDLPAVPDKYISDTLCRIRRGLERDVSQAAAEYWRDTGSARAGTRRYLREQMRLLRAARLAVRDVIQAKAARVAVRELMAAE